MTAAADAGGLRVLVVDDEAPARADLAFMLERDPRVAVVTTVGDGAEALRRLEDEPVDAVFLDIRMPGLDGLDLARVLRRFAAPPTVVFVSAHDDHAVDAFELRAVDYLLKPVRTERLADAIGRILDARGRPALAGAAADGGGPDDGRRAPATGAGGDPAPPLADESIPIELGGVTRFIRRSDIRYVEAHGDYARLVTATGRHLVRIPLSVLEVRWAEAGFVRIHRSWLVALHAIDEVRAEAGRVTVLVGDVALEVSRRHARDLRDRLVRAARPTR